jgi:UDP-glucuronate 4-epimerase
MLYQTVNVTGTYVLLEAARRRDLAHYVFGSSSSVYGGCPNLPFREDDPALDPVSPYAATKLIGEQIAYCYHSCHGVDTTCLRFFTVFGPRQRPEMAIHKFARAIRDGAEIALFGDGSTTRDYTYVDDIVDGVCGALARAEGFRIFNLGGGHRVSLSEMVAELEQALGRKGKVRHDGLHPGDMDHTQADVSAAREAFGYEPSFPFARGLERFVDWFAKREGAKT